eukprot:TRINITY_DN5161_c0_g1_i1.p1 TRINITY_DN5161_c0_g1~~TRINITY_DN5161_c0_g1_i1.p1  ORF type:complete len:323 (+),score=78.84 TRINITY_DN5161_c0_g1_i1:286-1254(+)
MGNLLSCFSAEEPRDTPAPPAGGKTSCAKEAWEESKWQEDTRSIWSRGLADLPVHMDLPRLAHRMRIFDRDRKECSESDSSKERVAIVHSHLTVLSRLLGEEDMEKAINDRYYEYVREDGQGDVSQQLLRFLSEVVGDNSRLGAVLRACHQKMVFPGFYSIKNNIFERLPFKDQRGTWHVSVFLRRNDHVEIRHRKTQVSRATGTTASEFEFDWELRITLDKALEQIVDISVVVCDLRMMEDVSEARAGEIRQIFAEFYQVGEQVDTDEGGAESGESDEGGAGNGAATSGDVVPVDDGEDSSPGNESDDESEEEEEGEEGDA